MKKDITSREDIDAVMRSFYTKALSDEVIGFYFTEVTHLDLLKHLPVIGDFWESVLLNNNVYHNNPMQVHQHINQLSPFANKHFEQWVKLFCCTVDELFEGDVAELAKQRATSIATVMRIKFVYGGVGKS